MSKKSGCLLRHPMVHLWFDHFDLVAVVFHTFILIQGPLTCPFQCFKLNLTVGGAYSVAMASVQLRVQRFLLQEKEVMSFYGTGAQVSQHEFDSDAQLSMCVGVSV